MKKLLTTITLFFPVLLFAQQKSGDFFNFFYAKISPTLLVLGKETDNMLPDQNLPPAIFETVGAKIRYAAVGFSTGYLKLSQAGSISPLGVDITITDFKAKRAFPVFTAQWHKVHFEEVYVRGGGYNVHSTDIKGKYMFGAAAGIALPVLKPGKIFITIGISRLNCKTTIYTVNGPYGTFTANSKDHLVMLNLAASLAF